MAIGPVVLLGGLASHPFIARLPDDAAVAALAAADPTRWGLVHLTVAVGSGLTILAFLALRSYLRGAGDDRSSVWGLPFITVGGTLFALLPGLEFAPMAAAEAGADVEGSRLRWPRGSCRFSRPRRSPMRSGSSGSRWGSPAAMCWPRA